MGLHAEAVWKSVNRNAWEDDNFCKAGVEISPPKGEVSELKGLATQLSGMYKPRSSATMMRKFGLLDIGNWGGEDQHGERQGPVL